MGPCRHALLEAKSPDVLVEEVDTVPVRSLGQPATGEMDAHKQLVANSW